MLEEVWGCIEVVGFKPGMKVLSDSDSNDSVYELSWRSRTGNRWSGMIEDSWKGIYLL